MDLNVGPSRDGSPLLDRENVACVKQLTHPHHLARLHMVLLRVELGVFELWSDHGDLCKGARRGVELDQRVRDSRLGLEQVERLIVRAPDRYDLAQAKSSSFRRWHIPRKTAA